MSEDAPDQDTDIRRWIGRTRTTRDIVTPRLVAEFGATFAPHLAPTAPSIAPPALHWCLAPETPAASELGRDGHAAKGGFLPPVALPRRMWAGGGIQTSDSLRVGDTITRTETIEDIAFKSGRGGALCFVSVGHVIATPRGEAIRETQTIVYREEARAGVSPPAAPAPDATPERYERVIEVPATTVLLFRYSAMTFNGHRFHYDQPYATQVEGYDDLVVHGPVQATLLLNLATAMSGAVPPAFTYRGVSPLTANQVFRVCGRRSEDGGFEGVTMDASGRICMRANTMPALPVA